MTADLAVELCRSAVLLALTIGGPVILAALAIGLMIGLIQAMTQLHDQTLAFVPKMIGISLVVIYLLPWGLSRMAEYASDLIREIPHRL
jgi:flagellar biosynthesis protein FliQ